MSMPLITLTPPSKTLISHPPEISTNTRDASFSSYLDGVESDETFVLKLGSKSTPNDHIFLGKSKLEEKELDVFGAEKYFNEANDHSPKFAGENSSTRQTGKHDPLEIFAIKKEPPTKATTPSIRSESSWNSRSALLHHIINPKNRNPKKANKKSAFLASIGCKCSCADKNSTDIDENMSKNGKKSDRFHGPMKSYEPERKMSPIFVEKMRPRDENDVTKRKSLEVYGSPISEKEKMCSGLEKKLTMMTWHAISPAKNLAEEIKIPSISSEMINDSDIESDASSDIFEIESFSKGNKSPPTTCYAPSEASVEWSVVTASAADYSAASDCELEMGSKKLTECPKRIGIMNTKIGILSGCKSGKAVRVGGEGPRGNYFYEHGFSSSRSRTTRFHDENDNKVASFGERNRQRSGNAAHLLYT